MKEIPLTQGKFALVDDADYEDLSQYNWHVMKSCGVFYAVRHDYKSGKDLRVLMHRQILGLKPGDLSVDHRNHDGLDNRRENLRVCTTQENNRNSRMPKKSKTSRFKGVRWHKRMQTWTAQIKVNDRSIWLGSSDSEEEAARMYNEAAKEYHGEFACLNSFTNDFHLPVLPAAIVPWLLH